MIRRQFRICPVQAKDAQPFLSVLKNVATYLYPVVPIAALLYLTSCAVQERITHDQLRSITPPAGTNSPEELQQNQPADTARQLQSDNLGFLQPLTGRQTFASVNNSDPSRRQASSQTEKAQAPYHDAPCLLNGLPDLDKKPRRNSHATDISGLFPLSGCGGSGDYLLSVDKDGKVYLWSLSAGEASMLFRIPCKTDILAFSERGALLAVAHEPTVKLFSAATGKEVQSLERVNSRITKLAFHPDGESLLLASADGEIYRWRFVAERTASTILEKDKVLERYSGHASVVSALGYHPFGRVFISGDWNGAITAWFAYDAGPLATEYDENVLGGLYYAKEVTRQTIPRPDAQSVDQLVISGDGLLFLVALGSGSLELWKVRGFKKSGEVIDAHKGLVYTIALSPDSRLAASAGRDGLVKIWEIGETQNREMPFKLTLAKQFSIPKIRKLSFVGARRLLAGRTSGEILNINIDAAPNEN
jgi:WD40 repeat protein